MPSYKYKKLNYLLVQDLKHDHSHMMQKLDSHLQFLFLVDHLIT